MWVTGAKVVHFWIFNADAWRGLHIALPRDERLIERIEEAEELFWRHVELDVPLPARAPTEALVPVGRTALDVSSNEDWRSLFEVLREANERVEAAKVEQDKLKALVSDLLADLGVDGVRCDGARANIVRKAGSERLDRKALVAAHPNVDLRAFLSVGAPSEYVTIETKSRARGARSKGASR
jgi:hypothetical protein